jgi:uncharacterized protein DUF4124
MRRTLFTLMLLLAPLALAQTVYKWVDEDGVVHYSDQPHPSAEKIHVKAVQTYKSQPGAVSAPASPGQAQQSNATSYQGCAISNPSEGAEFSNIDSLNIVVQTDPQLRSGDQVYVLLDGAPLNSGNPTGPTFNLSPVERGTHTVQGVVRDAQGGLMCQTPGVRFSVHQPSVQNPANPVKPH